MRLSRIILAVGLSSFLLIACGSDDTSGGGAAGAANSAGGTDGGAGSAGAPASTAYTGDPPFPYSICDYVSANKCTIVQAGANGVDADNATCSSTGDTPITTGHCPSDGLIGCCITTANGLGNCYYDQAHADEAQGICALGGFNAWQTTAP